MNENQNEMTSEQLDINIENLAMSIAEKLIPDSMDLSPRDGRLPYIQVLEVLSQSAVITLARQGLQLREADAEADDFAEKLNKYVRKGEHGIFETLDNLTAELEAAKQTLAALDSAMNREYNTDKGDKRSGDLIDDFTEFLDHHKRKEVELEALRKDKERLDWLDNGGLILNRLRQADSTKFYWHIYHNSRHFGSQNEESFALRTAIDSAMKNEKNV